jgi:hypothetical protein
VESSPRAIHSASSTGVTAASAWARLEHHRMRRNPQRCSSRVPHAGQIGSR